MLDSTLLLIGLGQNEKRGRWGGGRQGGKDSSGACLRAVLWSTTNYIDQVKKQTKKKTATFTHPEMQTFSSHLHSGITQGSCHLNSINTEGGGAGGGAETETKTDPFSFYTSDKLHMNKFRPHSTPAAPAISLICCHQNCLRFLLET